MNVHSPFAAVPPTPPPMPVRLAAAVCSLALAAPAWAAENDRAGDVPVRGDGAVVAEIDRLIARGWEENGVEPSPQAEDAEWLRTHPLE